MHVLSYITYKSIINLMLKQIEYRDKMLNLIYLQQFS